MAFAFPPDVTTVTMTAAIPATTASTPAIAAITTFRRFPGRPRLEVPGRPRLEVPEPTAGNGAVEGSDAYHGPDALPPSESLVTHATVPTGHL